MIGRGGGTARYIAIPYSRNEVMRCIGRAFIHFAVHLRHSGLNCLERLKPPVAPKCDPSWWICVSPDHESAGLICVRIGKSMAESLEDCECFNKQCYGCSPQLQLWNMVTSVRVLRLHLQLTAESSSSSNTFIPSSPLSFSPTGTYGLVLPGRAILLVSKWRTALHRQLRPHLLWVLRKQSMPDWLSARRCAASGIQPAVYFCGLGRPGMRPSAPPEASIVAAVGLDPPFAGCCSADPNVHNGCPIGDLYAATLSAAYNSSGAPVMF
jgi:hypothetical protein